MSVSSAGTSPTSGRRRLSLRGRLALLCAAAVAIAIATVSVVTWVVTSQALNSQVDASLELPTAAGDPPRSDLGLPLELQALDVAQFCRTATNATDVRPIAGGWQIVSADGTTCARSDFGTVTPTQVDYAAAEGTSGGGIRDDRTSDGTPVRVRTFAVAPGYALLILRDVGDIQATLRQLAVVLLVVTALGSLAALLTGWWVARQSLRPLDDLTATAEHIAATQDLDVGIPATGTDEIARLAMAFNQMTSALSASRVRQQQLIADASHELRTPLTSLRTNFELLARAADTGRVIPPEHHRELLASVVAQIEELSDLVSELTVLAHDEPATEAATLDLVAVVQRAVTRAVRRGDHDIVTSLQPWSLVGDAVGLERAVLNLLDNALKFSPRGSTITVTLRDGVLDVDDTGPGIPADDRERVFERFWRAADARSLPGSGLGLAIVADAASRHGGSAQVLTSPQGGARVRISLPGASPPEPSVAGPGGPGLEGSQTRREAVGIHVADDQSLQNEAG